MSEGDHSATKETYKKLYDDAEISEEYVKLGDDLRRKVLRTKVCRLSDESVTQDKLEYFNSLRSTNLMNTATTPRKEQKRSVTQLSKATEELIAKAKARKPLPQPDPVSRILSKPTLRERFSEVSNILTVRDLLAHQKFKDIVSTFECVDQMVLFLRQKKITPFWTQVVQHILENRKIRLGLNHIQQIIAVLPTAYDLSWMVNERIMQLDRWDLVVQLSSLHLDVRAESFKTALLEYVQSNGEFVEEGALPARPTQHVPQTVGEHVRAAHPESRALDVMKMLSQSNITQTSSLTQIHVSKYKGLLNPSDGNSLSERLLEKVRQKEQAYMAANATVTASSSSSEMRDMARSLYAYYTTRGVSNMFLCNVVTYLKNQNTTMGDAQVCGLVDALTKAAPNWIKYIENAQGQILRMDKSVQLSTILRNIESQQ